MTPSIESFGQWVKKRRKQRGQTQKSLGRMVGYAEITVRQIEKDSYTLSRFVVECLVNVLARDQDDREAIIRFALRQSDINDPTRKSSQTYSTETPFFGRERELSQISSLLHHPDCRCISIMGVGGVGKTHLALHVLDIYRRELDREIYFINLTDVTSRELMFRTIADEMAIALSPFMPPSEQLLQALQFDNRILVLDNFEQMLPEGAEFVRSILERAPHIKLMITSRERLQIKEEWSIRLEGLETSNTASMPEAMQLFISTAQRIDAYFIPSDLDSIQEICRVVQGIPLAVEMAASWTELYSCSEILSSLSTQVLNLTARHVEGDERHKTLGAAFETTWQRLSHVEQSLLKRLAIFRGGFTLDSATQVAAATPQLLAYLQDKMLIHPQSEGRLTLHEMIRQLALQKLSVDDDEVLEAKLRHAEYFVDLLANKLDRLIHRHTSKEIASLTPEIENVNQMWTTLCQHRRTDGYWRCYNPIFYFFNITSRFGEGESFFRTSMNSVDISNASAAEIKMFMHSRVYCGLFVFPQGRILEAGELWFAPEVLPMRVSSDDRERFWVHNAHTMFYLATGELGSSLTSAIEAKEAVERSGDPDNIVGGYLNLGRSQLLLGRGQEALVSLSEAVTRCRQLGAEWFLGLLLIELAFVEEMNLRFMEALDYYEAALLTTTTIGQFWNYPRIQIGVGRVKMLLGRVSESVDAQKIALETLIHNPSLGFQIDCFIEIAPLLKHYGYPALASILLEYCISHPECFEPARTFAVTRLTLLREEMPDLDGSGILLPASKFEVATLLIDYLTRMDSA